MSSYCKIRSRCSACNPEWSNIVGIPSDRVILWAFAIGSALVAVARILIAFDRDMRPMLGFRWLLYGVVAMIIGGIGSNWGLGGGALLLATVQHLAATISAVNGWMPWRIFFRMLKSGF